MSNKYLLHTSYILGAALPTGVPTVKDWAGGGASAVVVGGKSLRKTDLCETWLLW